MATYIAQETYEYQQTYPNSCGAACLLCAALELGVTRIPGNPLYSLLAAGPTPLAVNIDCEEKIYQVTSNNPLPHNPDAGTWGYSMPSNIVNCARMLGLDAWAVAYQSWAVRWLKIAHNNELSTLRAMSALVEPGGNRSFFMPVGHQRELKVLLGRDRGNLGALHYVMVRPGGSVMEPGGGVDYPSIARAKVAVGMHGTGLSVFIQE